MRKCFIPLIMVALIGWNAYAASFFDPLIGKLTTLPPASKIKYDNSTAGYAGDPTTVEDALNAAKAAIDSVSAGAVSDVDIFPGDTVDDDKIDSALINLATSTGLGVSKYSNSHFEVNAAGLVTVKANTFQPYNAGLTPWGSISSTAPVFTGSSIQSGVAGSQQGSFTMWSDTHAEYGFTLLPGTISESVTFRSPGAMPAGDNYLLNIDASTGQMDYTDPATFAAADHVHTGTYEPADANILKTTTTLGTFSGSTIADNQTLSQALQALETAVESAGTGHSAVTIASGIGAITLSTQELSVSAKVEAFHDLANGEGWLHNDGAGTYTWSTPSGSAHDAVTLASDAGAIFGLSTQELNLNTQTANYVLAGPTTGSAAEPTFRALVVADIPDLSSTYAAASHSHTGSTLSGIDISDDTNLTGTSNEITLTGDTLSLASTLDLSGKTVTLPSSWTSAGSATPGMTLIDTSTATAEATIAINSSGSYDAIMHLAVEDSTGESTPYMDLCGTCEAIHVFKRLETVASTTTKAGLNIPSGTAPTSPVEGDLYYDGTHLYFKPSGTAVDLIDATIMRTGSYSDLVAIESATLTTGYLHWNGSAFVYDTPSGSSHDAVSLGADADVLLGLSTQQITLDTQSANRVFAGPATGEEADPTFRALVADDIPDLSDTYQTADAVLAALAALENGSGVLTNDGSGNLSWGAGGGSMVYPGAGVPVSTGSAWGTSLTVGTGASNLVQLDESGKLPAVDGSSLTGLFDPASPGEIGGTTPAAATFTTLSAGATGFSVDADGDVTAKSLSITRVTGQASYSEYFEVPANGDNKVTVKSADNLAADYTVTLPSATGTLQLAGAEVNLPSSDADPDTTGEIRHDSTITGLLRGALKWFDGTGARILVDLDTAPSDDDYVVSYDADADKFYMKADATSAGGLSSTDINTSAKIADIVGDETGSGALVFGTSPQLSAIELGHATDTTIARVSAGVISVEGATVPTLSSTNAFTGPNTIGDGGDLIQNYLDSTPATDDTWGGSKMDGIAGEAIAQWDLVYNKNASGTNKWYKYDANGTDKLLCIGGLGIAVTSADSDGSSFTIGIGTGVARNDGWSHTTNQDEGKGVYASGTPGAITLTAPSTAGDEVVIVGRVLEENVILFNLSATIPIELK